MEKKMSKGVQNKFLNNNFHTSVLKVNIHCECDGCLKKVKKILNKIEGVYDSNIDADLGKVTVVGCVDSKTLIEKLAKAGKQAEIWPTKGANNHKNITNQFQNLQLHNYGNPTTKGVQGKESKNHKKQKEEHKGKGLKEMLSNLKDFKFSKKNKNSKKKKSKKSAKSQSSSDEEDEDIDSEYDDEFSDESDEEEFERELGNREFLDNLGRMKGMNGHKDKEGKNAFGLKGTQVINKAKNGSKKDNNGAKTPKNANIMDHGYNAMNFAQMAKNGSKKSHNNGHGHGHGHGNEANPRKNSTHPMDHGYSGANFAQMGSNYMQPNMGQFRPGGPPVAGHYGNGAAAPHDMSPYQQQYMQALLQQQQQRRMMMMNGQGGVGVGVAGPAYPPQIPVGYGFYGYGQPQPGMGYPSNPAQNSQNSYGMFSEENANGCSIM